MNRRQFLTLSTLIALTACSGKRNHRLPSGSTVLALGDSLTAGYGAPSGSDYPAVLSRLSGWQVVNGGVSGDTSEQAWTRLPDLLAEHRPKLVLVCIGGNDFLRRLPETQTRRYIGLILQRLQQDNIPAVLAAEPHFTPGALIGHFSDHPLYRELAGQYRVPLLEDAWSDILGTKSLTSDAIHANEQGYARFAEVMAAFLRKEGFR